MANLFLQQCWSRALNMYTLSKEEWDNNQRKFFVLTISEIQAIDQKYEELKLLIDSFNFQEEQMIQLMQTAQQLQMLVRASDEKLALYFYN